MNNEQFDRMREISKKLKEIFERDKVIDMTGMYDYIVRSVEEAQTCTCNPVHGIHAAFCPCDKKHEKQYLCECCGHDESEHPTRKCHTFITIHEKQTSR